MSNTLVFINGLLFLCIFLKLEGKTPDSPFERFSFIFFLQAGGHWTRQRSHDGQ
jgi:hypothetical protein